MHSWMRMREKNFNPLAFLQALRHKGSGPEEEVER